MRVGTRIIVEFWILLCGCIPGAHAAAEALKVHQQPRAKLCGYPGAPSSFCRCEYTFSEPEPNGCVVNYATSWSQGDFDFVQRVSCGEAKEVCGEVLYCDCNRDGGASHNSGTSMVGDGGWVREGDCEYQSIDDHSSRVRGLDGGDCAFVAPLSTSHGLAE